MSKRRYELHFSSGAVVDFASLTLVDFLIRRSPVVLKVWDRKTQRDILPARRILQELTNPNYRSPDA